MKSLSRFVVTLHLLFAQLRNGFRILVMADEARAVRPLTSVMDSSADTAKVLIPEDPTITLRFLALELRVSYGSAHAIVHGQLGRSKGCARWVSH